MAQLYRECMGKRYRKVGIAENPVIFSGNLIGVAKTFNLSVVESGTNYTYVLTLTDQEIKDMMGFLTKATPVIEEKPVEALVLVSPAVA